MLNKNRPYVICHMLTSLDGKIDGPYMHSPECSAALAEYGKVRESYKCRATIYGTTTMAETYADGFAAGLPVSNDVLAKEDFIFVSDAENYIVSLDPKGVLGWHSNFIESRNRKKAHVIEVLTEEVSNNYLAYLKSLNISYIFAGKEKFNCKTIIEKLGRLFNIDRVMISGGGITNWSFAQENLIDELSLIIAPVADGSTTAVSIFERSENLLSGKMVSFELTEARPLSGNSLFVRYLAK